MATETEERARRGLREKYSLWTSCQIWFWPSLWGNDNWPAPPPPQTDAVSEYIFLLCSFLGLGDVFRLRRVNIKLRDLAGQYHSCFRQLQDLSTRLCSEFKSSPEEVRPSFDKTFQGIQQEAQRRIHQLRICQAKYWPRASESEKEVAVCLAKVPLPSKIPPPPQKYLNFCT